MKRTVGALVVVGATSACGGDCVDCALPLGNRGFSTSGLTPPTAAAAGQVWWFAGAADAWLLDGRLPLEVAATTPSWTAVRVPADAESGAHTVVANDVERAVFVAEPDPATAVLPTELVLGDGRRQTIFGCQSTCFDTPFETVETTTIDGFAWTTQFDPRTSTPLILVDVWGPDDDVDDEQAPRLGDSIPLPDNWLSVDELVLQALPGETSLTVRLRSLLDASTGPQSRAE